MLNSSENFDNLSSDELLAQALFFLITNYEAVSSAVSHLVYHLAQNKVSANTIRRAERREGVLNR